MANLLFILIGFSCFAYVALQGPINPKNNSFICLLNSKPVKHEVSRSVILPPMVSALWKESSGVLYLIKYEP